MSFEFEAFSRKINENKVDIVQKSFGINYVLMVLMNRIPVDDINFEAFSEEELWNAYHIFSDVIADELPDGDICLDPKNPYTQMMGLSMKIVSLENIPKERPNSPFMFI